MRRAGGASLVPRRFVHTDDLKKSESLKRVLERFGLKEDIDPYVKYSDECECCMLRGAQKKKKNNNK